MRILLAFMLVLASSAPALAESNKIVVIGEDGSVSEIDIGPTPAPAPHSVLRKGSTPPPAAKSAPAPAKETTSVKPTKKPDAPKQAAKKDAPAKPKKTDKKQSAPKKEQPQKTTARSAPAAKQKEAAAVRDDYTPARPQRLGPAMTPEDAIRIALDAAPPARSVNAYPVNYKGLHAYEVVFSTENGNQFVYIDRETARIVK